MGSRAFSAKNAAKPHLVRGQGGLSGEIGDLRADVEEAFTALEGEESGAAVAQANVRLNTQPTAADTISIGGDVYEFVATLGSQTGTHIGVLRGVSAAAALANIIAAINGAAGLGTTYSAKGKENVVASIYNTDWLHIECAVSPGGVVDPGTKPGKVLANTLTSAVVWDQTNLGMAGGNFGVKRATHVITVDANNLANDFDLVVPGKVVSSSCILVTSAAGAVDATGKAASIILTNVPARNAVTVDLNGGATDPVATDIVYVQITYVA